MTIIDLEHGSFNTKMHSAECHFCSKTFESYVDYSDTVRCNVDGFLPCCEECMTLEPCTTNNHKLWTMTLECGSVSFDCADKCSVEDCSRMRGYGPVCRGAGGDWQEYAMGEFPVTVKFDRGSPDWETGVYDDFSFDVTLRTAQDDCAHGSVRPATGAWVQCTDCGKSMTDTQWEALSERTA
jgi:hypothetical protein